MVLIFPTDLDNTCIGGFKNYGYKLWQTGYKLIDIYTCEILIFYIEIWRMYGQFHVSYIVFN